MGKLAVLQAVRLKGRATVELAAASSGLSPAATQTTLEELQSAALVKGGPAFRITPEGRAALDAMVTDERAALDISALASAYHEFDGVNTALKSVVTAWQLKDPATPNDHTDPVYDAEVVTTLAAVDASFAPLLARIVTIAPRLTSYQRRFSAAITAVTTGDHSYVARPIMDSYHTVWFEFHEELIGLLALSRVEEAAAGRAV